MVGKIRVLVIPVVLLTAVVAFAPSAVAKGGKEEQRKYNVVETPALDQFLIKGETAEFSLRRHTTFEMVDFYLDTPDFQIKGAGLSLRLRRAIKDGKTEYEFQFKSEAETAQSVRMEMEEKELLPMQVAGNRPLTTVLEKAALTCRDIVKKGAKTRATDNAEFAKDVADLTAWLKKGPTSTLEPFQEMRARKIKIAELRPVMCGLADRKRTRIEAKVPGGKSEWVMEASLDLAIFIPIIPSKELKAPVNELEVENKHPDHGTGRKAMNRLETELLGKYGAKPGLASKYLQAWKALKFE